MSCGGNKGYKDKSATTLGQCNCILFMDGSAWFEREESIDPHVPHRHELPMGSSNATWQTLFSSQPFNRDRTALDAFSVCLT